MMRSISLQHFGFANERVPARAEHGNEFSGLQLGYADLSDKPLEQAVLCRVLTVVYHRWRSKKANNDYHLMVVPR
ncbi:hypothetical protein [Mesorhizobium sp. M1A.F.Ca.IN.022.07.1.1]|uniref:hypothetical protein n=1 Tax=Mesorhizobium sp. M1A.F.Ca.IN.022.07.1.1 TaxID=2496767 RepID=UPI0013E0D785|nr:hypothetical protein [Mesorhizobium sp. M1A.F.Ca.IN.022.07.1.1]